MSVYMQVSVLPRSSNTLGNIVFSLIPKGIDLSKFIKPNEYHTTVLYSRVGDLEQIIPRDSSYIARIIGVEYWTEHDNVLVCTLESPRLVKRHENLMKKYNLQYDFDEYKPHVTIANNIELSPSVLSILRHHLIGQRIILGNEHLEPLED